MTDAVTPGRQRVLMVGAGRRVRNNFLPVLHCLRSTFEITAICAPTPTRREVLAAQWNVRAVASVSEVNLAQVDVVAISVPTSQNAAVLASLQGAADRLTVLIDTPIVWNKRELTQVAPLLKRFKRVVVAEDYMNFPAFSLVRETLDDGLIGKLVGVNLNNIGFLYHGLALIRSFARFQPVRSATRAADSGECDSIHYRVGDVRASVIGPYRQHQAGGLTVYGTDGIITEFAVDQNSVDGQSNAHVLRPIEKDGRVTGYEIGGGRKTYTRVPKYLEAMRDLDFPDKSNINLMRGCGLASIFESIAQPDKLNSLYTYEQGLYDSFASRLASAGRLHYDPFLLFGSNAVTIATSVLSSKIGRYMYR